MPRPEQSELAACQSRVARQLKPAPSSETTITSLPVVILTVQRTDFEGSLRQPCSTALVTSSETMSKASAIRAGGNPPVCPSTNCRAKAGASAFGGSGITTYCQSPAAAVAVQ